MPPLVLKAALMRFLMAAAISPGTGPNMKAHKRIGTPLRSSFKNGGKNGSGNDQNIKTVEMAAKRAV